MINQGDRIFLLLTRSVDVGKEERNIVTAYERHNSGVIEAVHRRLLLLAIGGFIRTLTLVNCLVGY